MRRTGTRWSSSAVLVGLMLLASSCVTIRSVTPGDGAITVAFDIDSNCSGCTVIAEASVDPSFAVIAGSTAGTGSPLTITGLANGTQYFVRTYVRAFVGGEVDEIVESGTNYRVHTFRAVGELDVVLDRPIEDVSVLVVGGGGAGGASAGGGGGAGGLVTHSTGSISFEFKVAVGGGGVPSVPNGPEMDGGPSSFSYTVTSTGEDVEIIADGGGGGMSMQNDFPGPGGRDGGSGGGGTRSTNVGNASSPGTDGGEAKGPDPAAGRFGSDGGAGLGSSGADTQGGGGGGAGAAGTTPSVASPGGDGGAGHTSTITGAPVVYAGGGGGGAGSAYSRAGSGGEGGGGEGGVTTAGTVATGAAGTDGLGGGGGGGSARDGGGALGGAGGSGVVIVRYELGADVWPETVTPSGSVDTPDAQPSPPAPEVASSLALTCDPTAMRVGTSVTCTVTGGDAGIDILWRAAYDPVLAEAGVTLDGSGSGSFSFVVPAEALGEEVTVELVEWLAPVPLGVAGAPVPRSVPAGEGPSVPAGPAASALLAAAVAVAAARRQVVAGRPLPGAVV